MAFGLDSKKQSLGSDSCVSDFPRECSQEKLGERNRRGWGRSQVRKGLRLIPWGTRECEYTAEMGVS